MSTPPLAIWLAETSPAPFTDPADCKRRAARFETTIRRRNWLEYTAGALVLVCFAGMSLSAFLKDQPLIGAAGALIMLGVAVVLVQLHRRASLLPPRPETPCLEHIAAQYRRQYEALRAVPVWYLAPLIPGLAAFYASVGYETAQAIGWSAALEGMVRPGLVTIGVFVAIAIANLLAAHSLKRKVDAINALA
ncbi:MAG: hypothetical protein AAF127_01820 [Pseudomonadota bacterium]